MSGENHPRWKGIGKPTVCISGYNNERRRRIQVNGKNLKYARYLMEVNIGRKLKNNEIVHHVNGNRLDDSIDNLEIMTKSEHSKHHIYETQLWKYNVKKGSYHKCYNCKKPVYRENWQAKKSISKEFFCSNKCKIPIH